MSTAQIGEQLVKQGKLAQPQLERALRVRKESGEGLGSLLVQLGFVAERDLACALADALRLPLAEAAQLANPPDVLDRISIDFLSRSQAIPVGEDERGVDVAMADPEDRYTVDALSLALGKPIRRLVATGTDIQSALQHLRGADAEPIEASGNGAANLDDVEHLRDLASEAPVIRLVNQLIARAIELHASDIHIEPFEDTLTVRYRVDGVLRDVPAPPATSAAAVISRIKVLANLNIAERRLPQDGRIKLRIEGREIDMRISTLPTLHGESVVMRLLDQGDVPLDFTVLGFQGDNLKRFEQLLARPQGIVLVTGPTGSGKTTTLYAALETLNTPEKKILTVEDPVEYQLKGINQIQVKPAIDLTFANALRAILRQDPDIIMIGEMRDRETAAIAVQSALTGHKVFSTLHTNDAPSSVTRLLDMGVEDYLLTSTLDGIVAQRLVRKLCSHCRTAYQPDPAWLRELGLDRIAGTEQLTLYQANGCSHCDHSGYRGRVAILELLIMSEPIRKAILEQGDADSIRNAALSQGMVPMRDDGLRKCVSGLTTVAEVERVCQADDMDASKHAAV
jgi:general secretion pathway protein E